MRSPTISGNKMKQLTLLEDWKTIWIEDIYDYTKNQSLIKRVEDLFISKTDNQIQIEILLNNSGQAINFREINQ